VRAGHQGHPAPAGGRGPRRWGGRLGRRGSRRCARPLRNIQKLVHRLEQFKGDVAVHAVLRVNYRDREGVLRRVLALCTQQGFTVGELATDQLPDEEQTLGIVAVTLRISGTQPVPELVASLTEIPGVLGIATSDPDDPD